MCSEMKKEIILNTAQEIVKYIDNNYAVSVDMYHIAELINLQVGFVFEAAEEFLKDQYGE